jgi:hypothetical protein
MGFNTAYGPHPIAHMLVAGERERPVIESTLRLRRPDDEQAILIRDREWLQQHASYYVENRCRRTDT